MVARPPPVNTPLSARDDTIPDNPDEPRQKRNHHPAPLLAAAASAAAVASPRPAPALSGGSVGRCSSSSSSSSVRFVFFVVLQRQFMASALVQVDRRLYIKQGSSQISIVDEDSEPECVEYKIKETNMFTVDKYQQTTHRPWVVHGLSIGCGRINYWG
uniref:Uncharacterized protein n=1 Tax=Leersia perrieri TaxID=77586 RepID=A0A0D9X7J8_9ORYZ